jgi:hypothetical protein
MMSERIRDIETIWNDGLWPFEGGLNYPDPDQSVRHRAIYEVLSRIPDPDYQGLVKLVDSFQWFIPHRDCNGQVHPFGVGNAVTEKSGTLLIGYVKVLYLSPMLERLSLGAAVAVVAHELAHIRLRHKLWAALEYDTQEQEAWELASKWGFEKEVRHRRAAHKRRDTMEKALVEKLMRKHRGRLE